MQNLKQKIEFHGLELATNEFIAVEQRYVFDKNMQCFLESF